MLPLIDYELLDFAAGRKLERFGPWVLDRPAPGAGHAGKSPPPHWPQATARYVGDRADAGRWHPTPGDWQPSAAVVAAQVGGREIRLQLEPSPSGQVGLFPEHASMWEWVARQASRAANPLRVLNLFAYTGGSTLAAASAGAHVTHVDAARSAVARARRNAALCGLEQSVRWIVDDAVKFCRREMQRGRRYDALIFDPPTFGRGTHGETWAIHRDFLPLLRCGRELTADGLVFALVSCHTPGIGPAELTAHVSDGLLGGCARAGTVAPLELRTAQGRSLSCGVALRWTA